MSEWCMVSGLAYNNSLRMVDDTGGESQFSTSLQQGCS